MRTRTREKIRWHHLAIAGVVLTMLMATTATATEADPADADVNVTAPDAMPDAAAPDALPDAGLMRPQGPRIRVAWGRAFVSAPGLRPSALKFTKIEEPFDSLAASQIFLKMLFQAILLIEAHKILQHFLQIKPVHFEAELFLAQLYLHLR